MLCVGVFFAIILKKTIAIFEISSIEFSEMKIFLQGKEIVIFGTKNALLGHFWAEISKKTIVIFQSSTLEFSEQPSFMQR